MSGRRRTAVAVALVATVALVGGAAWVLGLGDGFALGRSEPVRGDPDGSTASDPSSDATISPHDPDVEIRRQENATPFDVTVGEASAFCDTAPSLLAAEPPRLEGQASVERSVGDYQVLVRDVALSAAPDEIADAAYLSLIHI